ncbi:hypothetical protein ACTHOQ_01840 [Solibacillus silvestris]|uniref:hypothetical protein n=1 Tax=Solibacillus silvestris TaxID=76853 RepID=UPI003F7E4E46
MDPIKDAMKESYKGHGLSHLKKLEIHQKTQHRPKKVLPVTITLVVTATIFLFVFLIINEQGTGFDMSASTANSMKGQDAVIAMMERKLQFQKIIEDGEITAVERIEYLRTSDWKLQLAFEGTANTAYAIPEATEEQGATYAALLFYMREYMLEPQSIPEVAKAFSEARGFRQLHELVPVLKAFVQAEYLSAQDEQMPANRNFFLVNDTLQIIIICMYALCTLFILKNIFKRQHLWITLLNVFIVIATLVFFFKPLPHLYAYDETALSLSSLKAIKEAGMLTDDARFITAATFDNSRFALIEEQQSHVLASFQREDNVYRFSDLQILHHTPVIQGIYHIRNDGQAIFVMAFTEGHPITKGVLSYYDGSEIEFQIEEGKAVIEAVYLPQRNTSFGLEFFDENGGIVR